MSWSSDWFLAIGKRGPSLSFSLRFAPLFFQFPGYCFNVCSRVSKFFSGRGFRSNEEQRTSKLTGILSLVWRVELLDEELKYKKLMKMCSHANVCSLLSHCSSEKNA